MGRPRQAFMNILLGRGSDSTTSLSDSATQCALEQHVRKTPIDTASHTTISSEEYTVASTTSPEQEHGGNDQRRASDSSLSRHVEFGSVQIREYTQVIGDHPHCATGCPLSLGWEYIQTAPESVADYEQEHEHRKLDKLRLTDEERHDRLVANEVSETEIRRVMRKLHRERECSVRCHLKAKAQFFCPPPPVTQEQRLVLQTESPWVDQAPQESDKEQLAFRTRRQKGIVPTMFLVLVAISQVVGSSSALLQNNYPYPNRYPNKPIYSTKPIVEELGLEERFDRWRFLQRLLDDETPPDETNRLLYQVLHDYVHYPSTTISSRTTDMTAESGKLTGSPERTVMRLQRVTDIVDRTAPQQCIPLLLADSPSKDPNENVNNDNNNVPAESLSWIQQLEDILPDPVEEEDAYKGAWDTVMELNGRESVKYNQQHPSLVWQTRCLAARVLIYYDFLAMQ